MTIVFLVVIEEMLWVYTLIQQTRGYRISCGYSANVTGITTYTADKRLRISEKYIMLFMYLVCLIFEAFLNLLSLEQLK